MLSISDLPDHLGLALGSRILLSEDWKHLNALMPRVPTSLIKRLLIRIPIPILALGIGLVTGVVFWLLVDHFQSSSLARIFSEELHNELHHRSRANLVRFDRYQQTYAAITRLLANHRRMAEYLDPIIWSADDEPGLKLYRGTPPPWLPEIDVWHGAVRPTHLLLFDTAGRLREKYRSRDHDLPSGFLQDLSQHLRAAHPQAFLMRMDRTPLMIASDLLTDTGYHVLGSLVLVVPIDSELLSASQRQASPSDGIVAIMDSESQQVLSTSDPEALTPGQDIEALNKEYVVNTQSFLEHDDIEWDLLFATLVSRSRVEVTGTRVLNLERRQRLAGAVLIILVFVALFVLVSGRISRLLRRVSTLSRRALDLDQQRIPHGNQLLILEEWIQDFVALVMRARDETRARHEKAIQASEALTAALMDTSLDSIITIDARSRIIEFNPTAEQTFGYRRRDVLGRPLNDLLLSAESRSTFDRRLEECLLRGHANDDPQRFELQAKAKEGEVFAVELAIKPTLLHDKLLFTTYVHDISERKRQENEIKNLAAIATESPIPVLRVNRPGVVTYANEPSEPLLKHWGCHRLQTLPVYWKQLVQGVLDAGRTYESEVVTDSGIFSLLFAPICEFDYVNIYARNITEMRAAEQEARKRQNELIHVSRLSTMGEMATGIAHELNQPLSAIVNYANGSVRRLKFGLGEPQELFYALQQIGVQANRAGEIIKRLRGMVNKQASVRKLVDLNLLALEACALVAHDTRSLEITIERSMHPTPLYIRADPVQIEQVLLNLIRNALDAMHDIEVRKRRLAISSGSLEGGRVFVAIHDNGQGIHPSVKERLFDPFFTTKRTGMGMGLAITQTIAAEHKGNIRADSWPGRGSVFTLELPGVNEDTRSLAS